MLAKTIKICPTCESKLTLEQLASSPELKLIGMSFVEDSIEDAYYFFQHETPECGTSFMVCVDEFTSLIAEPIPNEKMALRECCEEHCVNLKDLNACKQECYFAPYRRLLLRMIADKSHGLAALKTLGFPSHYSCG